MFINLLIREWRDITSIRAERAIAKLARIAGTRRSVQVRAAAEGRGRELDVVIAQEGTFNYVFDVTGDVADGVRVNGRLRDGLQRDERRLVGHAPVLEAVAYQREAWQLFARVTLTATDRSRAVVAGVSFSVERGLIRVLRPNDVLYISRTACGGIGLSIVRDQHLVAAAGAITCVPLGVDVSARIPLDLVRQAQTIFHTRDPEYHMRDMPVELSIAGQTRIIHTGRPQMGGYDVFVRHGFLDGIPGTDVCVSIERRGVCPDTAAHTSAQLLDEEKLQVIER